MHKNITKCFIFILLTCSLFTSGCSKKNSGMIIYEPDGPITEDSADESLQGTFSEDSSSAKSSEALSDTTEKEHTSQSENSDSIADEQAAQIVIPSTVMVHVCGAVLCEGVYELPTGSRVVDAIKAAGGFSEDADSDFINQALVLEDGIKIKVPTTEESASIAETDGSQKRADIGEQVGIIGAPSDSSSASEKDEGKVNINSATEDELCSIPGIGPSRAKSIIAYREENGRFGTIEDIKKVTGIKDKFFSKIKDHITV
ncbi:helix-hairpin-helix domain-containing protein [Butyrivibrio sp. WCE2006]|uniref:helix-hairpin-helix domain-containing protein n=1 Tax=Butyrivibrio sp. WCE2006 TaxID=1410611 RepID=UPI000679C9B0|nr:helix-hairpin-helix domain-containing protein [Butyrivibrio sp. WCE2006]